MEQQQPLDPLINAAVLAGKMHMMQQQQQPATNNNGGLDQLHQSAAPQLPPLQMNHHHVVAPQAAPAPPLMLHNVVHNATMYPAASLGGGGGQPLQSHPTLPHLPQQQQQQQVAMAAAPPKKKADHTNYNNSTSTLTLNHPQNETYKLKTNQYLLESSSRLDDAVSELTHYSSLLLSHNNNNNKQSTKSSAKSSSSTTVECITNIEQSIIPLLKICSNAMKDAGKYFAPFSGTVNIHNRNDAERKRKLMLEEEERVQFEVVRQDEEEGVVGIMGGGIKKKNKKNNRVVKKKKTKKKRPALLMIDEFVERNQVIVSTDRTVDHLDDTANMTTVAAAAATTTENSEQQPEQMGELPSPEQYSPPPTTRKRKAPSTTTTKKSNNNNNKTTTIESIIILRPQNGSTYTKSEAIAICKRYRKNSRERGLAIRAMIHKKFVLASRKTLYRLLQQDEEGKVLLENGWLGCGRPLKVDLTSLDERVGGGGGGVNKGQLLVNSSLTFEELDRGEENRILVKLNGKCHDDDDDENENEAVEDLIENNNDDNNNDKQQSKKKQKKQHSIPSVKKLSCSAPGCTNQVARRGLCVKHGMEQVDSKVTTFPLPPPRDGGTVYKKSECVEIAKRYKKGSSERRLALEAMIYRGYAKNSLKSLYRLLLNDEKGIPIVDDDWRGLGCPSVLSATEIDEVVERIKREDIRLSSDDDVRQLVLDALKAKGVTDESKLKFSATTVKNYGAIFKSKLSTVYWKNTDVVESQQQQQQQGMV
ncbi:hypothetical protein ACHAWT_005801 [Skeletonema menzelii]